MYLSLNSIYLCNRIPLSLSHLISSSSLPASSSHSLLSGGRGDVSLSVHEALRRGRDVPPPPSALPPPLVREQRLQRPVPPPRILLASAEERPQHIRSLQRHLHPAQPGTSSAAQKQAPTGRPGQPAFWVFLCRKLPNAPTVCWIPLHAHPDQVALVTSPRPGSSHGHASITRTSPSVSHTHAHERLPLLGRGKHRGGKETHCDSS